MRLNELISYATLGAALASPMACGDDAESLCEDLCDAYQGCCDKNAEDFCETLESFGGYSGCVSNYCESALKTEKDASVVFKGDICVYENYGSCDWGAESQRKKCLEEHDY
ncbi:MAG: hypothetical protein ABH824_01825 [Nanoarchaeota archaeon]